MTVFKLIGLLQQQDPDAEVCMMDYDYGYYSPIQNVQSVVENNNEIVVLYDE